MLQNQCISKILGQNWKPCSYKILKSQCIKRSYSIDIHFISFQSMIFHDLFELFLEKFQMNYIFFKTQIFSI